ncbi:MAG: hypothetical protein ACREUJ_05720 [Burkholderiales bacterium]
MAITLGKPSDKADRPESTPDSVSRSVVRAGAQAAAKEIVKRGAHAAAPAPQASLTVSRQPPSLRVAATKHACFVARLTRCPGIELRLASRIHRFLASNANPFHYVRGSRGRDTTEIPDTLNY